MLNAFLLSIAKTLPFCARKQYLADIHWVRATVKAMRKTGLRKTNELQQ